MKLINKKITISELKKISIHLYGGLVKAVVDINKKIMVIDGLLHADEEAYLINNGSNQDDLWGINLYPEMEKNSFIEFDSIINIRPRLGNLTRSIKDDTIKNQIIDIVNQLIIR